MIARAGRLAEDARGVMARRGRPWHVTQIGARAEIEAALSFGDRLFAQIEADEWDEPTLRSPRIFERTVVRRTKGGVPVGLVRTACFAISGLSGGIAGVILASEVGTAQADANPLIEFDVITAVVLGGVSILGGEGAIWRAVLGAFFLQMSGHGDLWFTSYGGIQAIDIDGPYIVDNGHLVGYEGNLSFNIRSAGGGLLGLMASGEGLVCEFNGRGRIYIQSRNVSSLVGWLSPLMPR
jgi:hypothetical protein